MRTPQGPRRKPDDVPGPAAVQFVAASIRCFILTISRRFYGPRYEVDKKQQFVDYQGWEFYISFDWSTGLQFFDIKFKGEQIIYELGVEECVRCLIRCQFT